MSGIAGIVHSDGRDVEGAALARMIAATPHLGIDGTPLWHDGPVGLIRFALHTTREAERETQPYIDPRSGDAIVFDGRLDNRDDLRGLLGPDAPGADAPDCEIVLAAWHRLGDALPDRLVGDYALAIWQVARRRLFAARSPGGFRPLLWTQQRDRFAFATEPATLVRGLALERRLNEGALAEHLAACFVSESETFWTGIYRLPPGHALAFEHGQVRTWRWLEGRFEDFSDLSEGEHIDRFQALFDQALHAVTRSNGDVIAQLSGGLDSSSIVCRIDQLARAGRMRPLAGTVSARYPGEICDEGPWIEAVEQQCGIRSASVYGPPFDSAAAARWSAQTLHLPLRSNTAGTLEAVCAHARASGARVVLTGEGGDDWLDGSFAHWPDLLLRGRWAALLREARFAHSHGSATRAVRSILSIAIGPLVSPRRRDRMVRPYLDRSAMPGWIEPEWAKRIDLRARWEDAPHPPALAGLHQAKRYMPYALARRHMNWDNVLAYAASQGIELRHPFHDLRLTRFLMGAAGGVLRQGPETKHLLREAMRGTLPELVRARTTKANISAPIIDAVSTRLTERPFAEMHCARLGWVDPAELERIHARCVQWREGGTGPPPKPGYAAVWNTVAADIWLEHAYGL